VWKILVLPSETEERVKRRAISVCKEHLRKVLNLTRKIPQMMESFIEEDGKQTKIYFEEISNSRKEVDTARRLVSQELAEIGAILLSREDFLRFTNLTSEIADFAEGIAFRLLEIMQNKWKIPTNIKKDILKLSEAVQEAVVKLRETLMVLNYGASKTMEAAKTVEIAEHKVDMLYRELEMKVLTSKLALPTLLLLRDILQLLENTADKAEDAADAARILSFIV